jgi:hypothetical protein
MPREGFVAVEEAPTRPPTDKQARPQPSSPSPQPQQPQQPEPPPPEQLEPKTEWPIVVKLRHKSIHGNKRELLDQLSFREPTGADIIRFGNPVWINTAGEIMFDERKMTAMMAQLSGVLAPLLEFMHPQDWNSCAYRLRRFFLPDPEAW